MDWLANRPSDLVFAGAGQLIHAMLETGAEPVAELSADALLEYARKSPPQPEASSAWLSCRVKSAPCWRH